METEPRHEEEQQNTHRHEFDYERKDWWCHDCETVTDYCKELNDFGQDVPARS